MKIPRFYDRPVIPILLSMMAGLAAGHALPGYRVVFLSAAVLCFILVLLSVVRNTSMAVVPLLMFAALGYLLIQEPQGTSALIASPGHVRFYADKGDMRVTGEVETVPENEKRDQTFILRRIGMEDENGTVRQVRGKLKVRSALTNGIFGKGDRIRVDGKIKPFHNFGNPGGFDYKGYMENQDIWGNLSGRKGQVFLLSKGSPTVLDLLRRRIEDVIDGTSASGQGKAVLKALITGSRQGIAKPVEEDFRRTGTVHLLSISGLHVAIVAGFSFAVFRVILSFIPALLWHGRVKALAGVLAVGPVWVYGFLSGMPPGTLRAVIMATVFLLTYGFQAEHEIVNTLALAALVILALSPRSLFDVSFQLSFGSVLSIVLGLSAVRVHKKETDILDGPDRFRRLKQNALTYLAVTVFAFAGTWPLVAFYFNQISLIGFVANAVLIPLMGSLAVTLGLGAVFLLPLGNTLSLWVFQAAGLAIDASLHIIRFFSSFSWASVRTVTPSILEMACYYLFFAALLAANQAWKTSRKQTRAWVFVAVSAALVLAADGVYWLNERFHHKDLRITYLDVGQGSSSLVEFPGGRTMLIDGGGFSDNEMFDVGEKLVAPALWSKKIAHVNTVVLTHPESDHMNGLLFILSNFRVDELWTNGVETDTLGFRRMIEQVQARHIPVRMRNTLADHDGMNGVCTEVFWPPVVNREESLDSKGEKSNNMSLVIRLSMGGQSFLFPGDIMAQAEAELVDSLAEPRNLKSGVVLVPHHGSKSSSSDMFLDAVAPEYAVISCGYKNWFRFPHTGVLERLAARNVKVFRTDFDGAVTVRTNGKVLWIETFVNGGECHDRITDQET